LAAVAPAATAGIVGGLSASTDSPQAPLSPLASPVDIVIAADESASISPNDMILEQTAARLLALGEFSPTSRIGVLGFGGPNSHYNVVTNPQPPVDPVCPMTQVDTAANRQGLSDCIGKLKARTAEQGNHTDFIDAINQGVSDLTGTGDSGRPLLLFLLTDGQLDMVGSPGYSGSNAQINAAANDNLLHQTLPAAKAAGVRIWPLGFGPAVDLNELQQIAAGGAQGSCSALPDATPHAITVANATQIETALPQIYANARCLQVTPGQSAPIGSGGTADLYVTVPDIATQGVLEVIRQDPRIAITYYDPDHPTAVPTQGSLDGQTFQLGGANGPVEALTVDDPLPGRWRIHLSAGVGVRAGTLVTTSVLWQGILHSDITVDPPNPQAGQTVTVRVRLQVRGQVINSRDLAGVQVGVKVSGASLPEGRNVLLYDNGTGADTQAGDGVYTGTLVIPQSASGTLTAVGTVKAQGLVSDTRSSTITIGNSLTVSGQITLPSGQVSPGGQIAGTLELSNPTGKPHAVRLVPVGTPPGVTVSPATISLPGASGTTSYPFTVRFAQSLPLGSVAGHIDAVDVTNPDEVYAQGYLTTSVYVPPKWYQHWWLWPLAVIAVVLLVAATLLARRARLNALNMEQVEIVLYSGGGEIDSLQAPLGCGTRFAFSVGRNQAGLPRLEADLSGASEFVARRWRSRGRGGAGIVLAQHGAGQQRMDIADVPIVDLGDGTALGYRDLSLLQGLDEPNGWEMGAGFADETVDEKANGHRRSTWQRIFGGGGTLTDLDEDEGAS
jgi:hypothetical protein